MKIKRFATIVEGPMGLRMPEETARAIERLAKGLPKDFTYRRVAKTPSGFECDPGERADVSTITTDAVDRDRECVLPGGGDWSSYNRVVPFAHDYRQMPAGVNLWIKPRGNGLVAKTQYPTKPADWGDAPWLPSAVLHLMQQEVPTCTGKSIGFQPLNIRAATKAEIDRRPELAGVPIIDKWAGIEYSVAPVPCNPEAEMLAVAKSLTGIEDPRVRDIIAEAYKALGIDIAAKSAPQPPAREAIVIETKDAADGDAGGAEGSGSAAEPQHAHQYSTTHITPPAAVREAALKMGKSIPREHLAEGGRENQPHITCKYGLHTSDPAEVEKALAGQGPVKVTLGRTTHFPATDDRKSDVVHCAVDSPDLHALHEKLCGALEHTATQPEYVPHLTLAYVHQGKGEQFKDMDDVDGLSFAAKMLTFSDRDGNEHDLELAGDGKKSRIVATRKAAEVEELRKKAAGANEGSNADGGATVPEETRKDEDEPDEMEESMKAEKAARDAATKIVKLFEPDHYAKGLIDCHLKPDKKSLRVNVGNWSEVGQKDLDDAAGDVEMECVNEAGSPGDEHERLFPAQGKSVYPRPVKSAAKAPPAPARRTVARPSPTPTPAPTPAVKEFVRPETVEAAAQAKALEYLKTVPDTVAERVLDRLHRAMGTP